MSIEMMVALLSFAAVSSWTPGPNNTILMASGINHGFKRTLPMVLAVAFGFPVMIAMLGLGLGQVFDAVPALYTILKYVGSAYMLYLAWKIATSKPATGDVEAQKPMTFLQGVLFQWVNPKGWILAVTALSAYTLPGQYAAGVAAVVGAFLLTGLTSAPSWALFGSALRGIMSDPRYFRAINLALAAALIASIVPMLRH